MHVDSNNATTRILLWDLPLRIFHWSLVLAVTIAIVSAKIGGEWMELHGKAGLTIIGLLVFRVTWGIVGSTHARFSNFAPTPAKVRSYLKGRWQGVGHNPLGALSVFGLLGLLAAQAATGLFSNDDISFNGPLYVLVEQAVSDRLTGWHHQLSNVLFALLGLHIVAVFFYVIVKRNNLIKPMLTGWKTVESVKPDQPTKQGSLPALLTSILVAVIAVYGASHG
jgi:cytochrome b